MNDGSNDNRIIVPELLEPTEVKPEAVNGQQTAGTTSTDGTKNIGLSDLFNKLPRGSVRPESMVREQLAYRLIWIYAGTLLGGALTFAADALTGHDLKSVQELFTSVLAGETGILGTVLGFYFGGKSRD